MTNAAFHVDAPAFDFSAATADAFKNTMRHLAGAVSAITVGRGEERTGFTATSVSSLSIAPPSIVVCLNRNSSSWNVLERHNIFCVNLLAQGQQFIADQFAGKGGVKGAARYDGMAWRTLATGAPAINGALANIDCELEEAVIRHSHAILIGRVRAVHLNVEAAPLLYWRGTYRPIGDPTTQ